MDTLSIACHWRHNLIDAENKEAQFLARVTDMVAHELRNVLATVKEHAEHMEDLLSDNGNDGIRHKELLMESLSAIRGQVNRGSVLAQRMDLFARGQDTSESELDLNELVEMLECLPQPLSRNKGIAVSLVHPAQPMMMVGNPMQILMMLTSCIDFLGGFVEPRDILEIRVSRRKPSGLMVRFSFSTLENTISGEAWAPVEQHQWDELEALATSIDARVALSPERGMLAVFFETEWI